MQIKLTDKTKEIIRHFSEDGLSGRYIASLLNLGKSTVNDYLNSLTKEMLNQSVDPDRKSVV
mgnify:CR=1 FL=1